MFKISEFSKLSHVSIKTLRYYDQLDLLKPAHTDAQNGYRYYGSDQLVRLHRIMAFKDLGFTLEQIKQLLRDEVSPAEIRGMFRLKQAEVQSLVQSELERLIRIEARLAQIEREGEMPRHEVFVKKAESLRVVSIRATTSRAAIPGLFEEIDEHLNRNGISAAVPHMVIWHSCLECESSINLEIACPVPPEFPQSGRFKTYVLPETTVASVTHISRPDNESAVDVDLGYWIERNGYRICSEHPSREIYLTPDRKGEPFYVTESQMPIIAAGPARGESEAAI